MKVVTVISVAQPIMTAKYIIKTLHCMERVSNDFSPVPQNSYLDNMFQVTWLEPHKMPREPSLSDILYPWVHAMRGTVGTRSLEDLPRHC